MPCIACLPGVVPPGTSSHAGYSGDLMATAAELADQYIVMDRGEIVQRGRGADMEAEGVRQKMSI